MSNRAGDGEPPFYRLYILNLTFFREKKKKKKPLSIFNIKLKILRIHFTITIGVESYASTIKKKIPIIYIYIYTSVGVQPNSEKINIDFVYEIVNFSSPNLVILKKKSKNTTKYHNIFIISSFSGSE